MNLNKILPELLEAKVITDETAERIRDYYHSRQKPIAGRLFTIFGVLGAVLVGLGVILIIAHNWDNLSKTIKLAIAFLPVVLALLMCIYSLLKKQSSLAWMETVSVLLFFAIGACISLISQIYNMEGELSSFLFMWMLAVFPIIYIMGSSMACLLFLAVITAYGAEVGYGNSTNSEMIYYWVFLLALVPFYIFLQRKKPKTNFLTFFHWMLPLSLVITLGTLSRDHDHWMFVSYMSMFALFYLLGGSKFTRDIHLLRNGYRCIGALGTLIILVIFTFSDMWKDMREENLWLENIYSTEFIIATMITLLSIVLLVDKIRRKSDWRADPLAYVFILFYILFTIGLHSPISLILTNLLLFGIGLLTILNGVRKEHLGILNFGLLIIIVLVSCRFFDEELSFVFRGSLFVAAGIGFFISNYWMIKKLRAHEEQE